jgi:hypothetical protein
LLTLFVFLLYLTTLPLTHDFSDRHLVDRADLEFHTGFQNGDPETWSKILFYPWDGEAGRTRPLYRPYQYALFLLFGGNDTWLYIWNAFLWWVVVQLVYTLARHVGRYPVAGVWAGAGTLLFHPSYQVMINPTAHDHTLAALILGVYVCLFACERACRREPTEPGPVVGWGLLAVVLVVLAMGLKETSVAMFPAMVFLAFVRQWDPNPRVRWLYRVVFVMTVLSGIVFWLVIRINSISEGSYTSNYEVFSISSLVLNVFMWSEFVSAAIGPLVFVTLACAVVGAVQALRGRDFSVVLTWRWMLWVFVATFFASVVPWRIPIGRLLIPGVAGLSVLIAVELVELWNRVGRNPERNGDGPFSWGVVVSLLVMWVAPIVSYPLQWGAVLIKGVAIGVAGFLGRGVWQRESSSFAAGEGVSLDCRRAIRTIVIVGGFYFVVFSLPMMWSMYLWGAEGRNATDAFGHVGAQARGSERLLLGVRKNFRLEIDVHLDAHEDRKDIFTDALDEHIGAIPERAAVMTYAADIYTTVDVDEVDAFIDRDEWRVKEFPRHFLLLNGFWAYPPRAVARVLGIDSEESFPGRFYGYDVSHRWIDLTWRYYQRKSVD